MADASDDDIEGATLAGQDIVLLRHPVSPAFAGLVARITGYRETSGRAARMTETASLIVPLVIGFGAPFAIALGREPRPGERWASFTAGLTGFPVSIVSPGAAHCIQIDFTPLGAYRFFGRPMRLFADRIVEIDDLEDGSLIALRERLGAVRRWSARFALVERFLARRLAEGPAAAPEIGLAYGAIVASGGAVRIAAIAGEVGW
ncbi:MAG TPA: AraC family transcriptional regulator, partial [Xanthobacteraceae bacterium]|nr:AraC family transcriptional regulator [Xanthobacteraceae bacterium]